MRPGDDPAADEPLDADQDLQANAARSEPVADEPTVDPSGSGGPGLDEMPEALRKLGPGAMLGGFRLLRELGRGGMGIVYLAEEVALRRRLALKVLPPSLASEPRVVERFLREAQAAARLRHPNIIPIYALGELPGIYYYSMEYVSGVPLNKVLAALREQKLYQKGRLYLRRVHDESGPALSLVTESSSHGAVRPAPLEDGAGDTLYSFTVRNYVHDTLKWFAEAADALEYAHQNGVIHRDIKPSNLLLAPDGHLRVADFGLAKVGDARSITRTGDLIGSPSYMSPEQAMTRRARVDHRTDIWSLGVTLYEFLTLRHPFEAKNLEVSLNNILHAEPRSPRALNPRLPKDVDTIILKCLEKDPDQRYATAAELAADLRSVLNYESIQARSASPLHLGLRYLRRHRVVIAISSLAVLLSVVGAFTFHLLRERHFADVDLAIAYFEGASRALGNPLDAEQVAGVQDELRRARRQAGSLDAAIDMVAMATLRDAESHLPTAATVGDLDAVFRALARLRLVYLHQRDEAERERMQKIDRATAAIRVRLVWTLADSLQGLTAGTQPTPAEHRFHWLAHFLGTAADDDDGLAREQNTLVRRNAVVAMARLVSEPRFGEAALKELRAVLADRDAEPEIHGEAVSALANLERARRDDLTLQRVRDRLLADAAPRLPVTARYHAVKLLAADAGQPKYREVLQLLAGDPAVAVAERAREALAAGG